MSRVKARAFAAFTCAISLSACAAGVGDLRSVSHGDRFIVADFFRSAAATGETRTVIVGNPFQEPKERFDQMVLDAMQGANIGPQTRFTTQPSSDLSPSFVVAMVFDPPLSFNADAYCRGEADVETSGTSTGRLRAHTVFCAGDRSVSDVHATITRPRSASDPAFRTLIRQSVFQLVPPPRPNEPNFF